MSVSELELPRVDLVSAHYFVAERFPDGTVRGNFESVPVELSDLEQEAMARCVALGGIALETGNPPVGAILLDHDRGLQWEDVTTDKTSRNLQGHAELGLLRQATPTVGNDLRNCTLVTTAHLCNTCTAPYAEGNIGRIVCGVPRSAVWQVARLMRPRKINMHDLLLDGDIDTTVTTGLKTEEILRNFVTWAVLRDEREVPA